MYLDILIVVVLFIMILKGYFNGFFLEALSFFGVIINIIFSKNLTPMIISRFSVSTESPLYPGVYAVIFFSVYLIMGIFIMFIKRAFRKVFRGKINSTVGGVLGLLKGVLISFVIILFYSLLSMNLEFLGKYGERSYSQRGFIHIMPMISEYFPKEYSEKFEDFANRNKIDRYLKNILKE